jgi:rhodanese-related sulfurtransferase
MVDVRYPNEWEAGHVEGAVHAPFDHLREEMGQFDPGRPVVTVCLHGARSQHAAELFRSHGFEVQNLDGGMEAWEAEGLPLIASDGSPGQLVAPRRPPDDRPVEMQRLQDEFLELVFAAQEYFGDHDPSEEEVRSFLRRRAMDEGYSPAEADAMVAGLGEDSPDGAH